MTFWIVLVVVANQSPGLDAFLAFRRNLRLEFQHLALLVLKAHVDADGDQDDDHGEDADRRRSHRHRDC